MLPAVSTWLAGAEHIKRIGSLQVTVGYGFRLLQPQHFSIAMLIPRFLSLGGVWYEVTTLLVNAVFEALLILHCSLLTLGTHV